jgi:hypothetical protein
MCFTRKLLKRVRELIRKVDNTWTGLIVGREYLVAHGASLQPRLGVICCWMDKSEKIRDFSSPAYWERFFRLV